MPTKLLKCQRVSRGDRIALLGLASPIKPEAFTEGNAFVERFGFNSVAPFDPSKFYGDYTHLFAANSVAERVKALHQVFADKKVKGVMAVRGGYGSAELLPHIKFAALKRSPRVFVGFSDITALLIALYQKCGMAVIHGPSLVTGAARYDANEAVKKSVDALVALISGEIANPFEGLEFERISGQNKEASGPLIGGNLSIFSSLMGTPWQPKLDNHVFFFEEIGEEPYRIHRMLMQMKLAGMFKKIRGVLVGNCVKCESQDESKPKLSTVVRDIFKDLKVPVLFNLPFGHGEWNFPLPLGVKARIFQNKLELPEKSVI